MQKYGEDEIVIIIQRSVHLFRFFAFKGLGLVIEWACQHQEELRENWELAQRDLKLKKIQPLK